MRFLVCALSIILASASAYAGTILVRTDGTGDAATIQAAVDRCAAGDVIVLASGVFSGPGNNGVVVSNPFVQMIRSESGDPLTCIMDCSGAFGFNFRSVGATCEIGGVSLRNGSATLIYNEGSVLNLSDLEITGNRGKIYGVEFSRMPESRATFSNCQITNNQTDLIGGGGHTLLSNCTIAYNSGPVGSAYFGTLELVGCKVYRNVTAGSLFATASFEYPGILKIVRSTLFENTCQGLIGWEPEFGLPAEIRECIIASNGFDTFSAVTLGNYYGPWIVTNNCYFGNGVGSGNAWAPQLFRVPGSGNIFVDPLMCDPYQDDFSLCGNSPCLAANNGGTLMGAVSSTCSACGAVPSETLSFGTVKSMFR